MGSIRDPQKILYRILDPGPGVKNYRIPFNFFNRYRKRFESIDKEFFMCFNRKKLLLNSQ
jgi:hypothetical protein